VAFLAIRDWAGMNIKERIERKILQLRCAIIFQKNKTRKSINKGIITIYHDYERHYHDKSVIPFSDEGVSAILDAERKSKVKATFNIVAKLMDDVGPIVSKIRREGHDIASHSYCHSIMTKLNENEIRKDIELSKKLFMRHGFELSGLRSPQSKWCFQMLPIMLDCGIKWSAENDRATYPYVIYSRNCKKLVRMPITMDDWEYEKDKISPNQMFNKIVQCVDGIGKKRTYGALGFHPWVQGKERERMKVFRDIIEYVAQKKEIITLTFGQSLRLVKEND
jgi:peptidoglycan/xylan/chitin deacetylase (PgdA/CDA1 family)